MDDYNSDDLKGKKINLIGHESDFNIEMNKNHTVESKDNKEINKIQDTIESNKLHLDTLDEPIIDTLKRDLFIILNKIQYVMKPRTTASENKQLRNCKFLFYSF
jgi:hypothetical protein